MNRQIATWLSLALAITVLGAAADVRAQVVSPYGDSGYSISSDVNGRQPSPAPPQDVLIAENVAPADSALAARVADLEKALKKQDDKAKADKEKAASIMSITPAGRLQVDTATFDRSGNYLGGANQANGVEFRRVYIGFKGTGFDVVEYKLELDFAGTLTNNNAAGAFSTTGVPGKIAAKDLYLQVNELPLLGHVRVGNFYEPLGLETVTSDTFVTFMERANTSMITPDRHIGIMAYDHPFEYENACWFLGAFLSAGGDGGMVFQQADSHTATAVTGRLTWLPWYDECTEGRGLLHLGIAGSFRDAWANQFPLRSPSLRPEEAHLASTYNATMNNIDYVDELGTELAFVYGPFSVQSEYVGAAAHDFAGDVHTINTFYIYTSFFLTGENRKYDRSSGTFTRLKPFENFFRVRTEDCDVATGKGAWEVGYRWSWADFSNAVSATGNASQFSNHTVGLSWYLNPYTKIILNDVYSTEHPRTGADGHLNTIEMRAQVDF